MPHKRIDLAIRAFNRAAACRCSSSATAPTRGACTGIAGPTVRFAGFQNDARVAELLARARALVVPATEEFGIAAVEAHAAGRPVIALREGGARETVIEGVNGTFFDEPSVDALADAVTSLRPRGDRPAGVRRAAPSASTSPASAAG